MNLLIRTLALSLLLPAVSQSQETISVRAEVWADNWYAIYVDDKLVMEDTTPYNTERSFNADIKEFELELPARLNIVIKDFKENDSGLEYIGSSRQQIGDGGFAAQIFDNDSNELIAVSNSTWRCLAIHRAPLNKSCVGSSNPTAECESQISPEPDNWQHQDFDASAWPYAVEHSSQAVRPHGGYQSIDWHSDVKLIWSDDIEVDNTVLCKAEITSQ